MTREERLLIQDLDKCDFGEMHAMHKAKVEARKNMTKEEKQVGFLLLNKNNVFWFSLIIKVNVEVMLWILVFFSVRFWKRPIRR